MRDLRSTDHDDYSALLEQLTALEGTTREDFDRAWSRTCDDRRCRIRVAEHDGRVVAVGTLVIEPKFFRRAPYAGHIEDVVVDAQHRGQGVCRRVLDDLLQLAHASGCYRATLNCSETNVGLYRNLGFDQAGSCMRIELFPRTTP